MELWVRVLWVWVWVWVWVWCNGTLCVVAHVYACTFISIADRADARPSTREGVAVGVGVGVAVGAGVV